MTDRNSAKTCFQECLACWNSLWRVDQTLFIILSCDVYQLFLLCICVTVCVLMIMCVCLYEVMSTKMHTFAQNNHPRAQVSGYCTRTIYLLCLKLITFFYNNDSYQYLRQCQCFDYRRHAVSIVAMSTATNGRFLYTCTCVHVQYYGHISCVQTSIVLQNMHLMCLSSLSLS